MKTTDKEVCNILVELMSKHGVKRAVVSPGSRNAPIIVALARFQEIEKYVVVDERSAAFVALGIAQQTQEPVAVVCTSGTALLNYSPAVAEAYYQKLPLIVVSADRPREWIDQDDSQTIRQFEALSQFVKKSYCLPARCNDDTARWYANRIVNDAMMEATTGMRAPVHINIELDEPLSGQMEYSGGARVINMLQPSKDIPQEEMERLAVCASKKKILVIAGFGSPDKELQSALHRFALMPDVAVATETIANLNSPEFVSAIDRTLLAMSPQERHLYVPDLLITVGGAIVSRKVKEFLRRSSVGMHWHVGVTNTTVDCMQALTTRIQTDSAAFFSKFVEEYAKRAVGDTGFAKAWKNLSDSGREWHRCFVGNAGWSDMKAFSIIFAGLPSDCRLQLSNGTTIRYAQLFGDEIRISNSCNRGVSGIDGSTSTALGASLVFDGTTVLITGDTSFGYDLSGLASRYNSPKFKIIVMNNGGGGIFRFIRSTSGLPELEQYFEVAGELPVAKYADAFGFEFFEAGSEEELHMVLPEFWRFSGRAALLSVKTDNIRSAEVLKNYFDRHK